MPVTVTARQRRTFDSIEAGLGGFFCRFLASMWDFGFFLQVAIIDVGFEGGFFAAFSQTVPRSLHRRGLAPRSVAWLGTGRPRVSKSAGSHRRRLGSARARIEVGVAPRVARPSSDIALSDSSPEQLRVWEDCLCIALARSRSQCLERGAFCWAQRRGAMGGGIPSCVCVARHGRRFWERDRGPGARGGVGRGGPGGAVCVGVFSCVCTLKRLRGNKKRCNPS